MFLLILFILGFNLFDHFVLLLVLCLHIYLYFLHTSFLEGFKFKFNFFLCINHISHLRFFITSIFFLIIFIIIFSSVSLRIDIVFINEFDVTRLGDYNKILSNLSKEEVTELTCDILNNESLFFDNPSNYFFSKLNNIPVPQGPLPLVYDYPNTNSFVSRYPGVRFADPRISEFCRLHPDKVNDIRENILYDFLLYNSESDFSSLPYPTLNVYHLVKLKGMTMSNLSYFSQSQLYEEFKLERNYRKNVFLGRFNAWKIYGRA